MIVNIPQETEQPYFYFIFTVNFFPFDDTFCMVDGRVTVLSEVCWKSLVTFITPEAGWDQMEKLTLANLQGFLFNRAWGLELMFFLISPKI